MTGIASKAAMHDARPLQEDPLRDGQSLGLVVTRMLDQMLQEGPDGGARACIFLHAVGR